MKGIVSRVVLKESQHHFYYGKALPCREKKETCKEAFGLAPYLIRERDQERKK